MIKIYDGMNYFRVVIEQMPGQFSVRGLYNSMLQSPNDIHIWVWEGIGGNQRRRDIYPLYKANREPTGENIFAFVDFFRDLLKLAPIHQVAVKGYEGDDVVATLARHYANKGHQVAIYSNDYDMMQLTVNPNIFVGSKAKENITPDQVRLFKTLVGDPSDNIKGVPGLGQKGWEICDKELIQFMIEHESLVAEDLALCGFSKKVSNWVWENWDQVLILWQITGMYDVPIEEIEQNWITGESNPEAANGKLKEFML